MIELATAFWRHIRHCSRLIVIIPKLTFGSSWGKSSAYMVHNALLNHLSSLPFILSYFPSPFFFFFPPPDMITRWKYISGKIWKSWNKVKSFGTPYFSKNCCRLHLIGLSISNFFSVPNECPDAGLGAQKIEVRDGLRVEVWYPLFPIIWKNVTKERSQKADLRDLCPGRINEYGRRNIIFSWLKWWNKKQRKREKNTNVQSRTAVGHTHCSNMRSWRGYNDRSHQAKITTTVVEPTGYVRTCSSCFCPRIPMQQVKKARK